MIIEMSFNRNNIIIIGESGVGKTSLLKQFTDNKFNDNELTTHGVAFRPVDYNYDGLQLKIAIWDSSSLPEYRQVSRLYYKDVSAALIVYDVTNKSSFIKTNTWINTIRENSNIIKYIALVGNKIDLRVRFDTNHINRGQGQEFAQRKNVVFYETSAKLFINVNELFSTTFQGMIIRYVLTPLYASVVKYKAIVLGDPNVGKSCLIKRLCGHPFPDEIDTTVETNFQTVTRKINHCSTVVEFWDTSGQHLLMPMYYRNAHTVILVYDIQCEQSFKNLEKYFDEIIRNVCVEEMPLVVLLGNKRDDKTRRQVDFTSAQEFIEDRDIIDMFDEVSAKTDHNFNKLLTKICNNLVNIYSNIPLNKTKIKTKYSNSNKKKKIRNWFKCGAKHVMD